MRRFTQLVSILFVLALVTATACSDGGRSAGPDSDDTRAADRAVDSSADDHVERLTQEHAGDEPTAAFASSEDAGGTGVETRMVRYGTMNGEGIEGYLAMPKATKPEAGLPGLLVIHEWWGLNENIETMARMLARQGYVTLAVDLYGGKIAETPEAARDLMTSVDESVAGNNLRQAEAFLAREWGAPRVGVIGWCFGGGWSLRTALLLPDEIDAAVIYYGRLITDRDRLANLETPILGIFGADDQGIPVDQVRQFESTLEELDRPVTIHVYEDAGHAFANPSGQRYQPEAAKDAWEKTVDFLARHLKG